MVESYSYDSSEEEEAPVKPAAKVVTPVKAAPVDKMEGSSDESDSEEEAAPKKPAATKPAAAVPTKAAATEEESSSTLESQWDPHSWSIMVIKVLLPSGLEGPEPLSPSGPGWHPSGGPWELVAGGPELLRRGGSLVQLGPGRPPPSFLGLECYQSFLLQPPQSNDGWWLSEHRLVYNITYSFDISLWHIWGSDFLTWSTDFLTFGSPMNFSTFWVHNDFSNTFSHIPPPLKYHPLSGGTLSLYPW